MQIPGGTIPDLLDAIRRNYDYSLPVPQATLHPPPSHGGSSSHRSSLAGSYTGHRSPPYPPDEYNISPTNALFNRPMSQPTASVSPQHRETRFGSAGDIGLGSGNPAVTGPSPRQLRHFSQSTPLASTPMGHTTAVPYLSHPFDISSNLGNVLSRHPSHVLSGNEVSFNSSSPPHYMSSGSPIGTGNQGSQWSSNTPSHIMQFPGIVQTGPHPSHQESSDEFLTMAQFQLSPGQPNQSFADPGNQGHISDQDASSENPFL